MHCMFYCAWSLMVVEFVIWNSWLDFLQTLCSIVCFNWDFHVISFYSTSILWINALISHHKSPYQWLFYNNNNYIVSQQRTTTKGKRNINIFRTQFYFWLKAYGFLFIHISYSNNSNTFSVVENKNVIIT